MNGRAVLLLGVGSVGVAAIALIGAKAPLLLVAIPALALAGWLVAHPASALGLLVAGIVLAEDPVSNGIQDQGGFLESQYLFYDRLPGQVAPVDLLLICAVAGTGLRALRTRSLAWPKGFEIPLGVLALGLLCGIVTGLFRGADSVGLLNPTRIYFYLLVIPPLWVNLVPDIRSCKRALVFGAILVSLKGVEGTVVWALQGGSAGEAASIVFYNPATNWLLVLFTLSVLGCTLIRFPVPIWAYAGVAVSLVALLSSLRRGFWLALIVGTVAVVLVAPKRRLVSVAPIAVACGIGIWAVLGGLAGPEARSAFSDRATSITPAKVQAQREDRYRLAERRNVIREVRAHPVTGLGIGVGWSARDAMPVEYKGGRTYAHVVGLLYWLRLGVLGVAGYLLLMWATARAALALRKAGQEPVLRAFGLGVFGALVGLIVAETTGSHTGSNLRHTVMFASVVGLLATINRLRTSSDNLLPSP